MDKESAQIHEQMGPCLRINKINRISNLKKRMHAKAVAKTIESTIDE